MVTSGHCRHADRVFVLKESIKNHVKPQNICPVSVRGTRHYVNHLDNSTAHVSLRNNFLSNQQN